MEQYTINEILDAVKVLEKAKKNKLEISISRNKKIDNKKFDIPSQTLKLIEEAEKTIKSKLQSE
tara:strand:+ start:338 stop:529 length:192 start_codon:yes stop_codon:yes gene_type:complete